MQEILILILFLGALVYLGNELYKQGKGEATCGSNCGCNSPVKNFKSQKKVANPVAQKTESQ